MTSRLAAESSLHLRHEPNRLVEVSIAALTMLVSVALYATSIWPTIPGEADEAILFRLPVGADGIGIEAVRDQPPRGPAAITVDEHGTIWIADTINRRVAAYDDDGSRVALFDLTRHASAIEDVAVFGHEVAILNVGRDLPTVVILDEPSGEVRRIVELPAAFSFRAGLSGIAYGPDGALLVEFEGGARTARLADAHRGSAAITSGWPTPAGQLGQRAEVHYGTTSFGIVSESLLGGVSPIGARENDVDLVVSDVSQGTSGIVHIGQSLQRRQRDGRLMASWTAYDAPFSDVAHPYATGPSGDVLRLVTRADHIEVVRIAFGR